MGKISYGIYIYHYPCLVLVDRAMLALGWDAPVHWLMFGTAGLAATILVATGSYVAVERPILRAVRSIT